MPEKNFQVEKQFQTIQIEPTQIRGEGGTGTSSLIIPIKFELKIIKDHNGKKNRPFHIYGVEALLGTKDYPKLAKSVQLDARKVTMDSPYHFYLEFLLDTKQIARIESKRVTNADLTLRLKLFVGVCNSIVMNEEGYAIPYEFVSDLENIQIDEFSLEVPQSQWIHNILPGMGYNAISLIEIPAASELIKETQAISLNELNRASHYFATGDYDKVVAHCRSALEPFKKALSEAKSQITSDSEKDWITKTTDATVTWLDTITKQTYGLSSKTHHPPSFGHFSKYEAQSIYLMTVSIVSYAGNFVMSPTI